MIKLFKMQNKENKN